MSQDINRIQLALQRPDFSLDVDVTLPATGIAVLFGASGSGKTSVLRCVAGLERPRQALIRFAGEVWQDDAQQLFVPTWQRQLGYVFQEASLFEHLDVAGNLRFGLRGTENAAQLAALDAAIELLGIASLLKRRSHQLSGGERQRVAIARALVLQPRLLLLDEPLASLDHARRQEVLPWLERLRDQLQIPMLYVSHAIDEVVRLADTVVALDAGQVIACGPVAEVLNRLDSPLKQGEDQAALLPGAVLERDTRWSLMRVDFGAGSLWLRDSGLAIGKAVRLRVLARDVSIATVQPQHTSIQNVLACTVQAMVADTHPSQILVQLNAGGATLLARITARSADALALKPGAQVWAQIKSVALVQ